MGLRTTFDKTGWGVLSCLHRLLTRGAQSKERSLGETAAGWLSLEADNRQGQEAEASFFASSAGSNPGRVKGNFALAHMNFRDPQIGGHLLRGAAGPRVLSLWWLYFNADWYNLLGLYCTSCGVNTFEETLPAPHAVCQPLFLVSVWWMLSYVILTTSPLLSQPHIWKNRNTESLRSLPRSQSLSSKSRIKAESFAPRSVLLPARAPHHAWHREGAH